MALGVAAAIALLGAAVWVQGMRLDSAKQRLAKVELEYRGFVDATRKLGEDAKARAKEQETKDKKLKEVADVENKDLRRELDARRRELRDERARAGGRLVPAAPASAARPDRAAFDRAELERALSGFVEEVEGLVGEGAKAVIDLNTARKWAQEKRP